MGITGKSMGKKQVTVWYKLDEKTEKYKLNHIDNGHVLEDGPAPTSEEQAKAWKDATWKKEHRIMVNNKIMP